MSNRALSASPDSDPNTETSSASSQGQLQVSHIVHSAAPTAAPPEFSKAIEIGGRDGPEPTRFGDWEKRGRCIDF